MSHLSPITSSPVRDHALINMIEFVSHWGTRAPVQMKTLSLCYAMMPHYINEGITEPHHHDRDLNCTETSQRELTKCPHYHCTARCIACTKKRCISSTSCVYGLFRTNCLLCSSFVSVCWMNVIVNELLCVLLQAAIRKELNDFKSNEMEVHESSRHLTRWSTSTPDTHVHELHVPHLGPFRRPDTANCGTQQSKPHPTTIKWRSKEQDTVLLLIYSLISGVEMWLTIQNHKITES